MTPEELAAFGASAHPPASEAELRKLEAELGCRLPADLRALYLQHNGMAERGDLPFRLMTTEEVASTDRDLREVIEVPDELRCFWTDDESNYAATYVSGPAAGRVCLLAHEEPDPSPLFRSVSAFYRALELAAAAGHDYYELRETLDGPEWAGTPAEQAADLALAEWYFSQYGAESDPGRKQNLAFAGMQLLPRSESHRLLEWLRSEDMWIQERACELLGRRGLTEAIPALVEVARAGKHNGRVAALTALRKFGAPAAEEVARLRNELEPQWQIYLKQR